MNLDNVGTIIASRKLFINGEHEVTITIGKPKKFDEGEQDYYCPYHITGIGNEKVKYAGGIDAIQALIFTLQRIGAILYTSDEYKNGNLEWLEKSKKPDLGLLVPDNMRDILP